MFGGNKKAKTTNTRIDSLIGENSELRGDLHFSGGLHIDGKIIGNVIASDDKALLTLSENGVIEGNVNVPFIVLNGKVSGDVHAGERIELAAQAQVIGNVYYNLIEMAMGAEVNGSLVHSAEKDAKPSVVTGIKSDEKKESSDNVVESTILGYLGPEGSK